MVDPALASRLQFALTTIVHIIFPVVSMGLAPFLVYFTWKEISTDEPLYERLRRFWLRIFGVNFAVGTVTGIVLEFEFGTNFAVFAATVGELFGGPLATEGMMAFFLESTFFGVLLFGRERVSDRLYMLSAVLVGLGTWLSAVWILVANSWMQTPAGFEMATKNGLPTVMLVNPLAAYLNPRFPWMFVHMQSAAVLSVALLMAGIAAYHIRYRPTSNPEFWRATLKIAIVGLLVFAPLQVLHGDAYARHVVDTQPQKFAAMEAVWETDSYVPEYIMAFPTDPSQFLDPKAKELFGIGIPGGASWLASGGDAQATIQGLNEFEGAPPVAIVFWSFRIMVGLGFWFIVLALWAGYRWYHGELFEDHLLHNSLIGSSVLGILAVEVGWIVTEVGRQPWLIQGVMKTGAGVTESLTGGEATLTLAGFAVAYTAILAVYIAVVKYLIDRGPPKPEGVREPEVSDEETPPTGVAGDD